MHSLKLKLVMIGTLIVLLVAVFIVMKLTDNRLGVPVNVFVDDENKVTDIAQAPITTVKTNEKSEVVFSKDDYFYDDTIEIEMTAKSSDVVEIYYTLDGSPPTTETAIVYTEPVTLEKASKKDKVNGYTVKACGKLADGTFTDINTHTYLISENINNRFDVLVFSLSTDPNGLYDYETGIFVEGKLRDDYKKESGQRNPDPPAPANYNMRGIESERPVFVEVFDSDGNALIAQDAGMRTFGGWSRAMGQKSIKLFARKEYDEINNTFNFDFFPDDADLNGMSITKYKRIVLRNNANDNPFGFIRDETIQEMASLTSLQDIQHTRPAAVFLNGEYYGFVWVKQIYDDNYLDDMNDIKDGEWAILSGGEHYKSNDDEDPFVESAIEDYENVYAYSEKDLTDDKVYKEFCDLVDVENFLTYYAVQTYVANGDWPSGNYKVYKYYGDTSLSNYENTTADGKWRWLLYDTDFGMGLYDTRASEKSLGTILGKRGNNDKSKCSDLLNALLMRKDVKAHFVEILCDLMNYQYSPANVTKVTRALEAKRLKELTYNFKYGGAQLKGTWSSMDRVKEEVNKVIKFGNYRPEEMHKQIITYLEIEDSGFDVNIKKNNNANIQVNSCLLDKDASNFSGFYYDINTISVSAQIDAGYEIEHWLVNGIEVNDNDLLLTKSDTVDGKIDVELIVKKANGIAPVIKLIDYEVDKDYIQIYNPYQNDINLKKFYISDDPENLYKQSLADYILKSGETLMLYCKNYSEVDALGGFALSFNLKNGETIYVTNSTGDIVQSIYLPKIKNKCVLVLDERTGKYYDAVRK